jgi:hypothetical protein
MAVAVEWVSRITTVALVMVLPGIGGQWLDARWGTRILGPLGFVFGLIAGMWHLLRMTKSWPQSRRSKPIVARQIDDERKEAENEQ